MPWSATCNKTGVLSQRDFQASPPGHDHCNNTLQQILQRGRPWSVHWKDALGVLVQGNPDVNIDFRPSVATRMYGIPSRPVLGVESSGTLRNPIQHL